MKQTSEAILLSVGELVKCLLVNVQSLEHFKLAILETLAAALGLIT